MPANRLAFRSLALFGLALMSGPVAAAEGFVVPLSESRPLTVTGSAADVLVGDPAIADVTVIDHHHILVHGRAFGRTNLVVMDGAGRTLFSQSVVVSAGDDGRVSLFRGPIQSEYACAVRCERLPAAGANGQGGVAGMPTGPAAAIAAPLQAAISN
jgi:hypothetical protein